ncbi:STAS domain-containing protein [Streptomyces sp. NPDC093990]|uniref:STAS domain-containing protein n=1 Tax=Streptomyces sp. NPDC093990 TaxID=3155306 RepID=UPI003440865B
MTDIENADQPKRLVVEHAVVDGVRVVTVRGEIDHDVREVLHEALQFEDDVPAPWRIVVDLSAVPFMDSSGINTLIACHRQVGQTQGWVRIAGAQTFVLRVLKLVGVDAVIACYPSVEQALHA